MKCTGYINKSWHTDNVLIYLKGFRMTTPIAPLAKLLVETRSKFYI